VGNFAEENRKLITTALVKMSLEWELYKGLGRNH
jgi:hypothetical protein